MKRATNFRVRKRDGRTEWLQLEKLSRSLGEALAAAGDDVTAATTTRPGEEWRSRQLARAVLQGLRAELRVGLIDTVRLADAALRVLVANGYPGTAQVYLRVGGERRRRRARMRATMAPGAAGAPLLSACAAAHGRSVKPDSGGGRV